MLPRSKKSGLTARKWKKRIEQSALGCYLPFMTTPTICIMLACGTIIGPAYQPLLVGFWMVINYTMVQYSKMEKMHLQMILGAVAMGIGHIEMIPVIIVFMLHSVYAKKRDTVVKCIEWMEDALNIDCWTTGGNSTNTVLGDIGKVIGCFENFRTLLPDNPFRPHQTLIRLRDNGIDEIDPDDVFSMERSNCKPHEWGKKMLMSEALMRRFLIIGTTILIIALHGFTHIVTLVSMLIIMYYREDSDSSLLMGNKPVCFQDGVYEARYVFFGFELTKCIAVAYRGVLHAPYHGMGRTEIRVGNSYIAPYYISGDIITYGGLPRYSRVTSGDILFANHESSDRYGHGTRLVEYVHDETSGEFVWPSTSVSGESGSPVWIRSEDGVLKLVGMVGHYGRSDSGFKFEHFAPPDCGVIDEDDFCRGKLVKLTTYPGSGKTRHEIPKYVEAFIARNRDANARCYVAGPTRVVAREIYCALGKKYGKNVGLAIAHSGKLNRADAPIIVTTHATLMVLIAKRGHSNVDMVVIDEAHIVSPSTMLCVDFAEHIAQNGGIGVLMSATLDGTSNRSSNYPIQEDSIQPDEVENTIRAELTHGRKVLIFTHSARGRNGCDQITEKLMADGINAVSLHRGTYTQAMEKIASNDYDVIVATNIAECGFNADIDTVIDYGCEYDFFETGGIIAGNVVRVSEASRTQRRGRVGRRKNGKYVTVESRYEPCTSQKAASSDYDLLRMSRKWTDPGGNTVGFDLTDGQFCRALDFPVTPTMATVIWDLNGDPVPPEHGREMFKMRYGGGDIQPECKKCCNYIGGWARYDHREHDIYHMIMDGNLVIKPYDPDETRKRTRVGLKIPSWINKKDT